MADGPIRLLNVLEAEDGREAEAENAVGALIARAEGAGLLLRGELLRDQRDPARLVMALDFATEEDLKQYLAAEWRKAAVEALQQLLCGDTQRFMLEPVRAAARR